ncbi:hypothetical protein BOX15_Mlig014346g1 [Macrostomum lignano]|uniref:WD_REPEATS_REGION domain-containing protein n=1 Tax=Macrostomum lignano TaxID=282301 RepID=A0A267G5H9_9PLAT|nr:hypothetical protein BOX15_Mlig014346g1 [Macrostomum lignano]
MDFNPNWNFKTFSSLSFMHIQPPKTKDGYYLGLARRQQVTANFINRLGLAHELKGHSGCVNCLEWSRDGSLLASGSDDCYAVVWDPHRCRSLARIPTGHSGNIFSVNFLPHSSNTTLVSGAADARIVISDVSRCQALRSLQCHSQRVKRLATAGDSAFLFWSASEDGTVRQFDLREKEVGPQSANVLVDLGCLLQQNAEAKCLSINPCRSEMLAVGANDHCVRLFDRRKLSLTRAGHNQGQAASTTSLGDAEFPAPNSYAESGQYYIPGHLTRAYTNSRARQLTVTYLTFSPDGRDLVANLGGEQVYTTSVLGCSHQPVLQLWPELMAAQRTCPATEVELPPAAAELKSEANRLLQDDQVAASVRLYTKALLLAPRSPLLLSNRAAALLKRRWDGDAYAAAIDCQTALSADPHCYKALYRLARAFCDMGWQEEAQQCVNQFRQRFPQHAQSSSFKELVSSLEKLESGQAAHSQPLQLTEAERQLRKNALDLRERFVGHCNTTTDIKEANFFGQDFLTAGSDDGNFFIWDRRSGLLLRALKGDESIVNCLQPHPTTCLLATSGIDPVVRLWSPQQQPDIGDGGEMEAEPAGQIAAPVPELDDAVSRNQRLMHADPLEQMLRSMGNRIVPAASDSDADEDEPEPRCRAS